MHKYFLFFAVACFFITQKTNAQISDTTLVDTISMQQADSIMPPVAQEDSDENYDDNEDGYFDTTVKHIYDTSQYFFNWKSYLNDRYTKEKITQRHLIDQEVKQMKSQDDFWYIPAIEKMETRIHNDPKYRDSLLHARQKELKDESAESILMQSWFNTLIWIIIIVIFSGALIYFLVQNKISIFSKESARSSATEFNDDTKDIFNISYIKLIQKAEKEKDYRVAVRLMFLQTLKLLNDTNYIQYQPEYTNLHYLQQLRDTKYYADFSKVSRSYEYAWYGKFDIPESRYIALKNDFVKLQNRIS